MREFLYDIYIQDISGKSRKELSELLSKEHSQYRYALLNKDRLSLSKVAGVSFVDAVIDAIAKSTYIYIQPLDAEQYFILVYINNIIIWVGTLAQDEVDGMLELHLHSNPDLKIYTYNYHVSDQFTKAQVVGLKKDPLNNISIASYQLKSISDVKQDLNKNVFFTSTVTTITVILMIVVVLFWRHIQVEKKTMQQKLRPKFVDVWQSYRQAINAPRANLEVERVLQEVNKIAQVPNVAVKRFSYGNNKLQISLVPFSVSNVELEKWLKKQQYLFATNGQEFSLTKSFSSLINGVHYDGNIMPTATVLAEVMDAAAVLGSGVTINVGETVQHSNYKEINLNLKVEKQPLAFIKDLFAELKIYPIVLNDMQGDISLNSFSGQFNLNIIGE